MPDRLWNRGDRITLRYVGHSHRTVPGRPGVLQGWPYIVVEDKPGLLGLWIPVGTRMKRVDLADPSRPLADFIHGEHPTDEFRRGECLRSDVSWAALLDLAPLESDTANVVSRVGTSIWKLRSLGPPSGSTRPTTRLTWWLRRTSNADGRMSRWLQNGLTSESSHRLRLIGSLRTVKESSEWCGQETVPLRRVVCRLATLSRVDRAHRSSRVGPGAGV